MALNFYDSYINNLSRQPKQQYFDDTQASIDRQFSNSSSYNIIQEEGSIGSGVYGNIESRLNKVFDPRVGRRLGDDYRKIIFNQVVSDKLGLRYQFENNIWIAVNSDLYDMPTSSVVAIRCNNNIKWVDTNDVEHDEPCHIDFNPTAEDVVIKSRVPTIEDEILIICQNNTETDGLFVNQRLLFGKRNVYRITKINDCIDNNVLYITLRIDQYVDGRDDFDNEVADNTKPDFSI